LLFGGIQIAHFFHEQLLQTILFVFHRPPGVTVQVQNAVAFTPKA
jgi:hypothetical protein